MNLAELNISINPVLNAAALNAQIAQLKAALGPLGKDIKPLDTKAWDAALKKAQESVSGVGKEVDKLSKKEGTFDKLFKFSVVQQGMNDLVDGLGNLTGGFRELDTATASLKTLGDEAAKMAPSLRDSAIQMSKELPFAAAELQQTMFDALASGVKGGEEGLKSFAQTAAKLGTGGGAGIGDATKLLAGQLNAYGKSAEEAAAFADIFFNTVNFGVTSIPELTNTLSNVIPTAAAAGVEIENIGGALAVMTSKGVPTAQSTTKLNQLLLELQKPGAALKPILDAAGVSLESLKRDDLVDTLSRVKDALTATGTASVQAFSSSEAAAAFNVLSGDIDGFRQTFEGVRDTAGSAQYAYEQMAGSVDVQTKQMMATVNAFVIEGLDVLGSGFVGLVDVGKNLAPMISTIVGLEKVIPDGLAGKAKDFGLAILEKVVPSLVTQTAATGGATAAQLTFNAAALANPIGITIAAIAALTAGWVLLREAMHDTAEEQLEDRKAQTAVIEEQKKAAEAKSSHAQAVVRQGESYRDNVAAIKELQAASKDESKSAEDRAAAATLAEEKTKSLTQATVGMTDGFSSSVRAGKTWEENLAAIDSRMQSATSEMITAAGEVAKLDAQLAQSRTLELNLAVDVAKDDVEAQLSEALDKGFLEGLTSTNPLEVLDSVFLAGFGNEISEGLFGTSFAKAGGEKFSQSFKDSIYSAKNADEIAAAQSEMIAKIAIDGEKMGIDKKEQQKVIESVKAMGAAKIKALEEQKKNEANLSSSTADAVAKAFDQATDAGKDTAGTVSELAKAFGISEEKARELALNGALKNVSTDGKQAEKDIEEIARKFGKSKEEALRLLEEQRKQTKEAEATGEAVKDIGDAFNESKKAAQDALNGQLADLAGHNERLRKAKTKEEKASIDAERKKVLEQGRASKQTLDALSKDEEDARRALGLIKEKKVKDEKDITEQLRKIRGEAANEQYEFEKARQRDETELKREEIARRQRLEEDAVADEIAAAKKSKDLTVRQKEQLEEALTVKLNAMARRNAQERALFEQSIVGAAYKKVYDDQQAERQAGYDKERALAQLRSENLEAMEVVAGRISIETVQEINAIKAQELEKAHANEIEQMLERNAEVAKATKAYQEALETGDLQEIEIAGVNLDAVKKAVRQSDQLIIETQRKQQKIREDDAQAGADRLSSAEIEQIEDAAERKRALTLFTAEQTHRAELEAAKGNQAKILEADRALNAARKAAAIDYLNDTSAAFSNVLALTQNFAAKANEIWGAANEEQREKEKKDHAERMAELREEEQALRDRLEADLISWEEYQGNLDDISKERAEAQKELAKAEEEREDEKRKAITDLILQQRDSALDSFAATAKAGDAAYGQMAAASVLGLGAMLNAQLNFGDAVLASLLDMTTKTIAMYIPEIFAAAAGLLGPIAGPIAAGGVIAVVLAKAAEARASIGANDGVVRFNPDTYKTTPRGGDMFPIMIARDETIFSKTHTEKHEKLFTHIGKGGTEDEYFANKYGSRSADEPVSQKLDSVVSALGQVANTIRQKDSTLKVDAEFGPVAMKSRDLSVAVKRLRRRQRSRT